MYKNTLQVYSWNNNLWWTGHLNSIKSGTVASRFTRQHAAEKHESSQTPRSFQSHSLPEPQSHGPGTIRMRESSSDQIGDVTTRTQPQQRVRTQTGQAALESSVSLVTRQSWHSQPQASAPSCVPGVLKAPHPGLLLLRWLLSGKTPLTPILCRGYRDSWEQSPRLSSVTLTTCRLSFLIYRMERIETLMPASQDCVRTKCNTIVFKCFSVCKLLFYVKMFSQL